jgi:hypothetical protein
MIDALPIEEINSFRIRILYRNLYFYLYRILYIEIYIFIYIEFYI